VRIIRILLAVTLIASVAGAAGCAKKTPLDRPLKVGEVSTGAGTLADARKRFEGNWDLVKLEVVQAGGTVAARATGRLTYDAYGNLAMKGTIDGTANPLLGGLLDYQGRAIIDAAKQQLRLVGVESVGDAPVAASLSVDKLRQYVFEGDLLKISTIDDAGKLIATATWKRVQ
jgi:outer membrane murein-binding lipoprotein Lpp